MNILYNLKAKEKDLADISISKVFNYRYMLYYSCTCNPSGIQNNYDYQDVIKSLSNWEYETRKAAWLRTFFASVYHSHSTVPGGLEVMS